MDRYLCLLVTIWAGLLALTSGRQIHDIDPSHHPHPHHPHHPHQRLDGSKSQPQRAPDVSPETLPGTCLYDGRTYVGGERFQPDACTRCTCPGKGGRARCSVEDCRAVDSCLRWKEGEEGVCCPTCLEKGCLHTDGIIYRPNATIPMKTPCESCMCPEGGGRMICRAVACPRVKCVDAVEEENQCCKRCPNGNNCWYGKEILPAGTVVQDGCRRCRCPDGPLPHWLPTRMLRAVCSMEGC